MRLRKDVCFSIAALAALSITPIAARSQASAPQSGISSLMVRPHAGGESIDVNGRGPAGSSLTIALVSTFSRDIPDVVLSRTTVVSDAGGAFTAVVSIAPGFMRGSILTVYATSPAGGPAAQAQYLPDAPNRGVVVPADQLPPSVR